VNGWPRRLPRWFVPLAISIVALLQLGAVPVQAAAPDVNGDTLVVVGDPVPAGNVSDGNARAVRDLALRQDADAYVFAGDLQYEAGELANYRNRWDPIWGGVFNRSYPVPGNHEYGNGANSGWAATGGGYFDYWGSRARPSAASYYSFNVNLPGGGHWHVVVLNSACGRYAKPPQWYTPSCALNGAMEDWLRADLAADDADCELAVFHEPAFATPLRTARPPRCGRRGGRWRNAASTWSSPATTTPTSTSGRSCTPAPPTTPRGSAR
jgi:hypothetical protein